MSEETKAPETETVVFGGVHLEETEATARGKVAKGQEPRKFTYPALTPYSINREDPGQATAEMLEACGDDLNRVAMAFIKGFNVISRSENEGMDEFSKVAKDVLKTREKDPTKFAWANGLDWDALVEAVKERFS